jgi:hypothetical protein
MFLPLTTHKHEEDGAYDTTSGDVFARRLTKHLKSAAHDMHFEIDYSSDVLPQGPSPSVEPTREGRVNAGKDDNYGFSLPLLSNALLPFSGLCAIDLWRFARSYLSSIRKRSLFSARMSANLSPRSYSYNAPVGQVSSGNQKCR